MKGMASSYVTLGHRSRTSSFVEPWLQAESRLTTAIHPGSHESEISGHNLWLAKCVAAADKGLPKKGSPRRIGARYPWHPSPFRLVAVWGRGKEVFAYEVSVTKGWLGS